MSLAKKFLIGVISLSFVFIFLLFIIVKGNLDTKLIFADNITPIKKLQVLTEQIKEVPFRMYGYLGDQFPAIGNGHHLKESRGNIKKYWNEFNTIFKNAHLSENPKHKNIIETFYDDYMAEQGD